MSHQFNIGEYHHQQLNNGLKIIVQSVPKAPVASMHFAVNTGSMHENPAGYGLSHFLEHMIFKGSQKYSGITEISDTVQECGGHINAYTTKDHTCYHIDCLTSYWEKMLDVLIDAVTAPLFPEDEFNSEKEVILREQNMYADDANSNLQLTTWQVAADNHPFGIPVIGFRDKIVQVNRSMMLDYYNRRYQPLNSTIVVVGDVNAQEIINYIEERLNSWENKIISPIALPPYSEKQSFNERDIFFEDNQARVMFCSNIPTGSEDDIPALDIIETILAGSSSSLLINRLKKRSNLAISVSAMNYFVEGAGIFCCFAACEPDKLHDTEKVIFSTFQDLIDGNIDEQDIERSITKNKLLFLRQMQTASNRAQMFVNSVIDFGSPNYWESYFTKLMAVDINQIKDVAKKYFEHNRLSVVRQRPAELQKKMIEATKKTEQPKRQNLFTKLRVSQVKYIENQLPFDSFAHISIVFPDGSLRDKIEKLGTSYLLTRVLLSASSSMAEEELLEFLDTHGISINFASGNNTFRCEINCLPEEVDKALAVVQDIFTAQAINETVFEREKNNLLQSSISKNKKIFAPAMRKLTTTIYGENHPYQCSFDGHPDTIVNIELEDIRNYLAGCFQRDKMVVSVAGNVKKLDLQVKLDNVFSELKWVNKTVSFDPIQFTDGLQQFKLDIPRKQALSLVGLPGIDINSKNRPILDLVVASLNGLSSRIFKIIREDNALSYDTGFVTRIGHYPGYLLIYALTEITKLDLAEKLICEIIGDISNNGLNEEEFLSAKLQVLSERAFDSQSISTIATNCALNEYFGLGHDSYFSEINNLQEMTYDEFCSGVKEIFKSTMHVAVQAGDFSNQNGAN